MIQTIDIRVLPKIVVNDTLLKKSIAKVLHANVSEITDYKILKRSIDARSKTVLYQLRIQVGLNEKIEDKPVTPPQKTSVQNSTPVIIVGAGPAGLFAALELIQLGLKPIVLERGKDVRDRRRDLAAINKEHVVNPESNYCFGEGGAGTYSDGKLYTRSGKRGNINYILDLLIQHGANPDIAVDAHPHIGTNKLPKIITSIREFIKGCGGEVHFNTKVEDFKISSNEIRGVVTNNGEITSNHVILATGHSARDIFNLLQKKGIKIEAKPFALGVRIEHPQTLIDSLQYKCDDRGPILPPASYSLVTQTPQKPVYSFCMCPGGIIAPCATAPGEVVTNGWSPSKRNNPYSNSGIVVAVDEKDFKPFEKEKELAGLAYQAKVEQKAWEVGGKTQVAPAQRMVDFIEGKLSNNLPQTSYQPGIKSVDLFEVLPPVVAQSLAWGLKDFGKKMKGYLTNDAVLHATESRTSSPVKIPRDHKTLQHIQIKGLYPCGEGAGYAGGIMSAAIDGVKCAQAIKTKLD